MSAVPVKNVQGTESQVRSPYSKTSPIMTEYPTAVVPSSREVDGRRTRGVSQGGYAGSSDTTPRVKKKKGACDAAAQVVIGVEQILKDKKDNVAATRQRTMQHCTDRI